jgi:putative transposase
VTIKGKGADRSRAVDKEGQTVGFLLMPRRERAAAEACLEKAMRHQGLPEKSTSDQSGSNTAALKQDNKTHTTTVILRQSKALN